MKLYQQNSPNQNTIRAVEPGKIKINDEYFEKSLLLTATIIEKDWPINNIEQLNQQTIEHLLTYQPEIILIGSGLTHHFLDPRLAATASAHGIGIEIMTTEAACRTFNVLLGEDRAVLAALVI